jgi:hypothetical protein
VRPECRIEPFLPPHKVRLFQEIGEKKADSETQKREVSSFRYYTTFLVLSVLSIAIQLSLLVIQMTIKVIQMPITVIQITIRVIQMPIKIIQTPIKIIQMPIKVIQMTI